MSRPTFKDTFGNTIEMGDFVLVQFGTETLLPYTVEDIWQVNGSWYIHLYSSYGLEALSLKQCTDKLAIIGKL
jgi:hypothetical protein